VNLVRWNGIGDNQQVVFRNGAISCDKGDHESARIAMQGMQPVLGPNQWIHLCMQDQPESCSNVYQIR
jgi:predicted GH43/DUF377 family glycosyl hydrolase